MKNIIRFTIFILLLNMFSAVFFSLDKVNAENITIENNSPVQKAVAGGRNSAIKKMDGTVWLWGDNSDNQLGRENVIFSSTPVSAIGLKNIKSISTSNRFSMAVMEDGTLWWWGNTFFPLQDSYNTGYSKSNIPVQLEGIDNVKEVSLGDDYAIILKKDGTVYSVGSSYYGRLGTGGSIDDPNRGGYSQGISQIETLKDVVAVSVSKEYALALKEDGTVWAWGRNNYGQLGNGTLTSSSTPVQVLVANNINKIVAGENTSFAIDENGFLWGWGRNSNYLIGSGSGSTSTPTLVYNLTNVTSIEANSNFALIKKSDGTIWGWGKNSNGLLNEADGGGTVGPTLLNDLEGIAIFKTAPEAIVAVTASGKVKIKGKLFEKVDSEYKVENLDYISNVSISEDHVLVLNEEGIVKAWGKNDVGQLGNGNLINSNVPLMLPGITNIVDVKPSISSFILLNSAGEVFIVGSRGKTNNSTALPGVPNVYKIDGLNHVKKIATSGYDVLALTVDGSIWKYTRSSGGDPISFLTKEISQGDFIDIACSNDHYVALKEDGTVWNWGNNDNGQLGDGTLTSKTTPVKTLNIDHVTSIHAQPGITIALRDDGTVWGWGSSHSYLLGPNSQAKRILPTQIQGLSNIKELYITENRAFAKDADHVFYGWGEAFGIINNPTDQFLSSPVKMDDVEGVQEIAPSSQFQLMVKSDGSIYAKGINYEGELGTGSYNYAYEPTKVVFDLRSSLANIVTFSIGNEFVPAQIDLVNHEVKLIVPSDTDLTNVRPNIGISVGSTIEPSNEEYQDFTSPADYNVTAEDGTVEKWKVTVLKNTEININVQFETFGGTLLKNQVKNFYSLIDRPEDPEKQGYEFKGWYKDENLSSEYDFAKKLTEDITLYAKWEP
ncbi:InlB B-repeat-containing protein, partial [Mesobacillus zeae]